MQNRYCDEDEAEDMVAQTTSRLSSVLAVLTLAERLRGGAAGAEVATTKEAVLDWKEIVISLVSLVADVAAESHQHWRVVVFVALLTCLIIRGRS